MTSPPSKCTGSILNTFFDEKDDRDLGRRIRSGFLSISLKPQDTIDFSVKL